jgi:hypothetical protein
MFFCVLAMPHLRSKWIVNKLVEELNVPTTMLGPAHFAGEKNVGVCFLFVGHVFFSTKKTIGIRTF